MTGNDTQTPDVGATDRELWEEPGRPRSELFGVLFERHAKAVYNFCFRQTGSWSAAEDLVSVVFLEALRRHRSVSLHHDSALPWLYGVATNVCRNSIRSARRSTGSVRSRPDPVRPSRTRPTGSRPGSTASGGCVICGRRSPTCRGGSRR